MKPNQANQRAPMPPSFRPLFWSRRFDDLDLREDEKTVIIQLVNYGTLRHRAWLKEQYGADEVRRALESVPATEVKPRTRALAEILFSVTRRNHALRGAHA